MNRPAASLLAFLAASLGAVGNPAPAAPQQPAATTCAAVNGLSREQAFQQLSARITGVVTYEQTAFKDDLKSRFSLVVQDETGAVYVTVDPSPPAGRPRYEGDFKPRVGTRIEVSGRTMPGGYAPVVAAASLRELGVAPLPEPRPVTLTDLRTGRFECQRVELCGVVQRTFEDETLAHGRLRIELSAPEGIFSAIVADPAGLPTGALVDAEVRVRGACFTLYNSRGEGLAAYLQAAGAADIEVVTPAPVDPFVAPAASSYALNPHQGDRASTHRQRLAGIVTLWRPGQFMYVHTPHRSFRVHTRQTADVRVGDLVEVSGFIRQADGYGVMTEAVFRKTGEAPPPEPLEITRDQVMRVAPQSIWSVAQEDYDGRLLRLRGKLVRVRLADGQDDAHQLYLDCDGELTIVTLGREHPSTALDALRIGSDLSVTGIGAVRLAAQWPYLSPPKPASLSIQMRDLNDIVVRSLPSWWSFRRFLWVLTVLAALLLALLIWGLALRRTVIRQTGQITEKIAIESRLEERQRIGRDLHDTLQQELTGIGMLIDHAQRQLEQPEDARETLNMAGRMVERASRESRSSILDLQSVTLETRGLHSAIEELVRPLAELGGAAFALHTVGEPVQLPRMIETALLRIAHEAAANAGRHSLADKIDITLEYSPSSLQMTIRDDGVGFDLARVAQNPVRNFGLLSMDERALKCGGKLSVSSAPGKGVCVTLTVPLS